MAGDIPELDRLVDDACSAIGAEIDALRIPHLAGVVLGGGYGRGEGGMKEEGEGKCALSNDLDFFAVTEDGVDEAVIGPIAEALVPISRKWTGKLGVDVDFAVKTPWRLKHDEERIMVQELMRGYFDVAGSRGDRLFANIDLRPASAIPWMEAARLMMNRGMGLLFARERGTGNGEHGSGDFAVRNINKCILGAGDARLVSRHEYAWRVEDRAKALGDSLYCAAMEWKFRPKPEPVCGWDKAREVWLEAYEDICGSPAGERASRARNVRNAARWLVRRRTIGKIRTFGLDPVVRVLGSVKRHVEMRRTADDVLMDDWKVFN